MFMNCQRQDACANISPNKHVYEFKNIYMGHSSHKQIPSVPKLLTPNYMGVFLKWWVSPHFTPQVLIIFSSNKTIGCWGNPPF